MAQFTNQATITYNGVTNISNVVTGEVTQVLTASKDATLGKYYPGDILNYIINIQNSGPADITGLTLNDDLGEYIFGTGTVVPLTHTGDPVLHYINGAIQGIPTVDAGPPLQITGINVPAGGTSTIVYRAQANEYAPLGTGKQIENTVTISGGGLSTSVEATEIVTSNTDANLTITKALSPTTVVENGQVVYTFTLQNIGETKVDAAAALVIEDTFSPALSDPIVVTLNGQTWGKEGHYTYDAGTGAFATVPGIVEVPAATITQDLQTGIWTVKPGVTTITVTGTI